MTKLFITKLITWFDIPIHRKTNHVHMVNMCVGETLLTFKLLRLFNVIRILKICNVNASVSIIFNHLTPLEFDFKS